MKESRMKAAIQETSIFTTKKVVGQRENVRTAKEMLGNVRFKHCGNHK